MLVHLPVETSLESCQKWASDYLISHPDTPISGVIFYQPSVTTTIDGKSSHILHVYAMTQRQGRETWFLGSHATEIAVTVGMPSTSPSKMMVRVNSVDYEIENQYFFQAGHVYTVREWIDGIGLTAEVSHAYGVTTHSLLKLPGGAIQVDGNFPPEPELWLF